MGNHLSKKVTYRSEEEKAQLIIKHWIRIFNIKLERIHGFDKLVIDYVMFLFIFFIQYQSNVQTFITIAVLMLDTFFSSAKVSSIFYEHNGPVNSIDYSTFGNCQLLCSGSDDNTVRVWDIETNKQIQSFNGHSSFVYCVKFSQYHNRNNRRNVICSSSEDKTIRSWDIKDNKQFQTFNGHTLGVNGIEFSQFNSGRYLYSVSSDKTIRLWDAETSKPLHIFNGHTDIVKCVDISPLQSNGNDSIGLIGGNGYTFCSGSYDRTIRMWDIETTKQLIVFKGHKYYVSSVKYGSNALGNTILSGSEDDSIRLWDIRSGKQIRIFIGHAFCVNAVEFSPFVANNIGIGGHSNVICSGSSDKRIRFWDIRTNDVLYVVHEYYEEGGVLCLKFLPNKKSYNLCYGSKNSSICIWG
ncbi:WD-40 repeat-containing protein [Reticulomyxa filosa]|uniref:WD-40 repeat-containing protein n=1 Tax=Reticulomyxa filosa TaxID=46433 RepID=X6NUY6_RETFI|nr:WD-40 repeat-containing protein [Reticulomyxa filosa]|eukprot:ETO29708.1 WD-40 repeat-containing protein [Reticulomyxa filosa]